MKKLIVSAALLATFAAPLQAQSGQPVTSGPASFYIGPYVGYMIFGDLFEGENDVEYTADDGVLYGVQTGISISPNFSLLGNLAYNRSEFQLENVRTSTGTQTQTVSGDIGVFLYDAGLQFRLPFEQRDSWIAPFLQLGAGAIRYTQDPERFNSTAQTDVQFNAGIGADFQWRRAVGIRLMAKDYITSLNWSNDNNIGTDVMSGQTAHNFAISAGLNIGF